MSPRAVRPVVVMGILLTALGYAATKEWQWQADAGPLLRVAQVAREDAEALRDRSWQVEAVTVRPEQIFQD
ncbi:MAG: hypothetical protein ACREKJ_01310 [Candidatus Rokuibacteriota bacterium]